MQSKGNVPVEVMCLNCYKKITAWRDEKGMTKSKCPRCGTITITKVKTRRHVQYDVYAPDGQTVIT